MTETKNNFGVVDIIKEVFKYISQSISLAILPSLEGITDIIMNRIEKRMILLERRIMKNLISMWIFGLGGMFFVLSLFFFLVESIGLSKTNAFFSIGMTIIMIGFLIKLIDTIGR